MGQVVTCLNLGICRPWVPIAQQSCSIQGLAGHLHGPGHYRGVPPARIVAHRKEPFPARYLIALRYIDVIV